MNRLTPFVAAAAIALSVSGTFAAGTANTAVGLETQTSSVGGVSIKVTPKNMANDVKTWDFTIALDTHSRDLSDDLVKSSLLFDGAGGQHSPTAWDGFPPGGHHREGVLQFKPVSPVPAAIELQIKRSGETAPRSFRWQLK